MTKQRAIRERFGFSPSRYHQLLHRIIDRPEALVYDPMLVRRLRRVREVTTTVPDGLRPRGSRLSARERPEIAGTAPGTVGCAT